MKTNLFNFKRVGLLFQRYFIERFRTELIYWGIMAIVFMFFRNNIPAMFGLIIVAGVFYTSRFFKEIHHSANGVAYFMIPATQLEKLTVAIVMTTLYYYAMMMMVYVAGNLAGTFLNNLLADMNFLPNALFNHSPLQWKLLEETGDPGNPVKYFGVENMRYIISIFRSVLIFQPLFLLGGIYFKKNQTFKTFSSVFAIQLLLVILFYIEAKLILGGHIPDIAIKWNLNIVVVGTIVKIFYVLLSLFFWVVSYFRLTEKQV